MHLLRSLLAAERAGERPALRRARPAGGGARARWRAFRDAAADPAVWRPLRRDAFHVTLAFLGHRRRRPTSRRCAAALAAVPVAGGRRSRSARRCCCCPRARPDGRRWRTRRAGWAALQATVGASARRGGRLRARGAAVPAARDRRRGCARARGRRAGPPLPTRSRSAFARGPVVLYRSLLGRGGATTSRLWQLTLASRMTRDARALTTAVLALAAWSSPPRGRAGRRSAGAAASAT